MINQGKNIIIGIFVVSAVAILIFILLYLHPTVGDMEQTIYVRFDNIDKVTVGTRVNLGGKPVGEVVEVREVPEARTENALLPGPIYIYELTLKIDSHIKIYNSDVFSVRTSGLLGERSIEITPAPPQKGKPLQLLTTKDVVFAESSGSVEDAVKDLSTVAKKASNTLDTLQGQLVEINQRKFWENISTTAQNLSDISTALNQPKDLRSFVKNLHALSDSMSKFPDKLFKTWDVIDELTANFKTSSLQMGELTARLQGSKGTIWRLLEEQDTYLRFNSIMSKADTLMDDINHYGLLFHSNKNWQRVRARRVNLMKDLCTPQEFRNFFEDEINQISTSLSRVAKVMEETSDRCDCDEILSSQEFAKVFAELLRRVKSLEENIELYDQQVMEYREGNLCPCTNCDQSEQVCLPQFACEPEEKG